MSTLLQDLHYALRALAKRPGYAAVTTLVLILAIGANTTVFSVLNAFLLRPLPYPDDERLVAVYSSYPKMGLDYGGTSIPDYLDRRAQAPSLEELAILAPGRKTLDGDGPPQQTFVVSASSSLFDVLGIGPALGRVFTSDEDILGNHRVVVLSYGLWQSRFGGRDDVIGREVGLDGEQFRIVGVMPERFGFPSREVDAYVPLAYTPEMAGDGARGAGFAMSVGRLKPGGTTEGLTAELDAIVQRIKERLPADAPSMEATGYTGVARPLRELMVGGREPLLLVLQAVVVAVLLIACANIANLQFSRLAARRKELSVRAALGADRRRLVRLVLAESVVLAAFGAIGAALLARGGIALVHLLGLVRSQDSFDLVVDPTVLGFTAGIALFAALASSVLPLIGLVGQDLARSARELRVGGGGRASQGFRNGLVVAQLALGVTLLVGAGLLTKSFYDVQQRGPGFDAEGVWTAGVALPPVRYADGAARARFFAQALAELRALPGVTAVGVTSRLPFSGQDAAADFSVEGYAPPAGTPPPVAELRSIDEGYLASLGIPLVQGRGFGAAEPERTVIVDDTLANRFWPGASAIGQRIGWPNDQYTVIGVVPHVKHMTLTEEDGRHTIYWHYTQRPEETGVFTVRAAIPTEQLTAAARDVIATIDPTLAIYDVLPLSERVLRSLGPQRTPMVLTLLFAAVAVTLAIVGIYGVLTWAVTQRTGEIGVRMALGAQIKDVVRLVLRQGAMLIVVGLVLGTAGAFALGRVLAAQLREVSAADPFVLAGALGVLAVTAAVASWLPARRAARVDPMQALRSE